jgi:hypothetical protein
MNMEEVAKPSLGKDVPRSVRCNITVDLSAFTGKVRDEWEAIREHDVLFLVCIENPSPDAAKDMAEFEGERQAWSRGEKPRKREDFQKKEEGLDFPQRYGKFKIFFAIYRISLNDICEKRLELEAMMKHNYPCLTLLW